MVSNARKQIHLINLKNEQLPFNLIGLINTSYHFGSEPEGTVLGITGSERKCALRSRIIKGYDLGKGRVLLIVANSVRGELEGWTFLATADKKYIQRQRVGELIYAED